MGVPDLRGGGPPGAGATTLGPGRLGSNPSRATARPRPPPLHPLVCSSVKGTSRHRSAANSYSVGASRRLPGVRPGDTATKRRDRKLPASETQVLGRKAAAQGKPWDQRALHSLLQAPRAPSAADLALAAHQAGGCNELDGVAQGGLQPDAGQHRVGVFAHLHILLLAPMAGAAVSQGADSARRALPQGALLHLLGPRGVSLSEAQDAECQGPLRHRLSLNLGWASGPSHSWAPPHLPQLCHQHPPASFSNPHNLLRGHCFDAQPSRTSGGPSHLPFRPRGPHGPKRVDTSPARTGCGGSALCLSRCRGRWRR